jgi:hypothetical protein
MKSSLVLYFSAFVFAVRMPIGQTWPINKIGLITRDPYQFVNTVKYCHNYPDIMCYERGGNGYTPGDEAFWSIQSCTDFSGLGAVEILFPHRRDSENLDDHGRPNCNGLCHDLNTNRVLGASVLLFSAEPSVRFHPGHLSLYAHTVPYSYWHLGHFVEFSGPPNGCFIFVFRRDIYWSGQPPPYDNTPIVPPP